MISNRLAVLMAERGLKITRVAKDTGISRNTITSTAQNDGEMIRLETINTLCKYLGVTPCEFFEYEPIDIRFSLDVVSFPLKIESKDDRRTLLGDKIDADLFMDIDFGHQKKSIDLSCDLVSEFVIKEKRTVSEEEEGISIILKIEFDENEGKEYFVNEIYNEIDSSFYKSIYNSLFETVKDEITKKVSANIDYYIEKYLNTEEQFDMWEDTFRDNFFAGDLKYFKNNINVEIVSDVFKPF